jgi:hypothetical protein
VGSVYGKISGDKRLTEFDVVKKNEGRCLYLVQKSIRKFDLNLSNLEVLTEAASGYYALTSLMAALAGAEMVYAVTKDSRYGNAEAASKLTMTLAKDWGIEDRINVLFSREDARIGLADIITNLGFVRPLDAHFLRRLKRSVVISLMFETWEYREDDLNLLECRKLGIPVLGTNEHHPDLRTFEYIGLVAMKLLFEMGIEVFRSNIIVMGSGEFAEQVILSLRAANATVTFLSTEKKSNFVSKRAWQALKDAEAVVIVEHQNDKMLIGKAGVIKAEDLYAINPLLVVVHICGGVDRDALEAVHLRYHPARFAPARKMSIATDYLGPKPLIDLHAAGLKVGEELARARARGLLRQEAEFFVLQKTSLAQGFHNNSLGKG